MLVDGRLGRGAVEFGFAGVALGTPGFLVSTAGVVVGLRVEGLGLTRLEAVPDKGGPPKDTVLVVF